MIKREHLEHEDHADGCHCCSDGYFNMMCEQDPELEEKARIVNETIKQRALEIKIEREKNSKK